MSYIIEPSSSFVRDLKRFRNNPKIKNKIARVLTLIAEDPFRPVLRTHSVDTSRNGKVWSSRVTGDLRLLWIFNNNKKMVIIALKLGGHDDVYA